MEDRILCVDPGLVSWAYAVFDASGFCVESKTITYKGKQSQESRLYQIFQELDSISGKIQHIIIESQFVQIMGQIVGLIRGVAGKKNITTSCYVPSSWRKQLTGSGKATEEEVKKAVEKIYKIPDAMSEHELDCYALYLAHKGSNNVKKPTKSRRK